MTWLRSASGATEDAFPAYRVPARPALRLAVAKLKVVVADARVIEPKKQSDEDAENPDRYDLLLAARIIFEEPLEQRFQPSVGTGSAEVVLRVTVREISEKSDPARTRVVVGVTAETARGRVLVATSGTTELVGTRGSMSGGSIERFESGILDAAERAVLRESFLRATNDALAAAASGESDPTPAVRDVPPAVQRWSMAPHVENSAAHVLGLSFDAGRAYAVGLRYVHEHFETNAGVVWLGYGLEGRVFSENFDSVDAAGGLALGRVGFAVEQGISLEGGVGVAGADRARPFARVGLGYGLYFVELAAGYEFPFAPSDRPAWMPAFTAGLRVNVPVDVHAVRVSCKNPSPCSHTHVFPRMGASGNSATSDDAHR